MVCLPPLVQSDRLGTTTRDMVTLYRHILLEEPDLVDIMGMRDTIVKSANGRRKITNSNSFLRNDDVPFSGISGKTGATCQAGFAITMSASQDDETLIVSYVGGKSWRDREERVSDILQEAFDEIKSQKEYQLIMELF